MKFISNEPNENEYHIEETDICDENTQKKKSSITKKSTKHTLQRKRQKIRVYYGGKSFKDFRLVIVDPPQKLDSEESKRISCYFGISSENQSN